MPKICVFSDHIPVEAVSPQVVPEVQYLNKSEWEPPIAVAGTTGIDTLTSHRRFELKLKLWVRKWKKYKRVVRFDLVTIRNGWSIRKNCSRETFSVDFWRRPFLSPFRFEFTAANRTLSSSRKRRWIQNVLRHFFWSFSNRGRRRGMRWTAANIESVKAQLRRFLLR